MTSLYSNAINDVSQALMFERFSLKYGTVPVILYQYVQVDRTLLGRI